MADVLTIDAFGRSEPAFFEALAGARVGLFCGVRRRRGVRGAEYAFVNSVRLQGRLRELGIPYVHRIDLAPSEAFRRVQAEADARDKIAKRARSQLGDAVVAVAVGGVSARVGGAVLPPGFRLVSPRYDVTRRSAGGRRFPD